MNKKYVQSKGYLLKRGQMGGKKRLVVPVMPGKGGKKHDFYRVRCLPPPSLEVGWLPETPQNKIGRRCFLGGLKTPPGVSHIFPRYILRLSSLPV